MDEDIPYLHCQLRNLKKIQLVIVRTMWYMRIGIVSSKRRCDGTLVKRNQKLNLELSKEKQKKHANIQQLSRNCSVAL